jgi:hypothetical protein
MTCPYPTGKDEEYEAYKANHTLEEDKQIEKQNFNKSLNQLQRKTLEKNVEQRNLGSLDSSIHISTQRKSAQNWLAVGKENQSHEPEPAKQPEAPETENAEQHKPKIPPSTMAKLSGILSDFFGLAGFGKGAEYATRNRRGPTP